MKKIIVIDGKTQVLQVFADEQIIFAAPISTAKNGFGEQKDSEKTPRGWHVVRAKIGKDLPLNTVFVGRRPNGELYDAKLMAEQPGRDLVLTRILWLSGLELGKNRLGAVDSMQRYIYIHGTPEVNPIGVPLSHGCVRMRNEDVLHLFDLVDVGTKVLIKA